MGEWRAAHGSGTRRFLQILGAVAVLAALVVLLFYHRHVRAQTLMEGWPTTGTDTWRIAEHEIFTVELPSWPVRVDSHDSKVDSGKYLLAPDPSAPLAVTVTHLPMRRGKEDVIYDMLDQGTADPALVGRHRIATGHARGFALDYNYGDHVQRAHVILCPTTLRYGDPRVVGMLVEVAVRGREFSAIEAIAARVQAGLRCRNPYPPGRGPPTGSK